MKPDAAETFWQRFLETSSAEISVASAGGTHFGARSGRHGAIDKNSPCQTVRPTLQSGGGRAASGSVCRCGGTLRPTGSKTKNPAVCVARRKSTGTGAMAMRKPAGAQFEVSIDGTPRTYRDDKATAIEAAENLKRKYPHSTVAVENLHTGEKTVVDYKPDLGPRR